MRVLFIDIDTLRADHLGCYGYSRNTSPHIDQIAKEGTLFQNYYCSDAPCLPSRASLVTGMFGIRNGAVGHGGTAAEKHLLGSERRFCDRTDTENLHNIFRRAGMHTVSVSTFAERHSSWWFHAGFHETYNVGGAGQELGEEVCDVAMDWLRRNENREDWFMHVHFWDPHTPYRTPADFKNPFESQKLESWIDEAVFEEHRRHIGPHSAMEINMYHDRPLEQYPKQPGKAENLEEMKYVIDQYDGGILYTDIMVGKITDFLKEKGMYEDTAIIITSDHGENMGELGIYAEHGTADRATCQIPMIIKWPGCLENHQDKGFHYSLDLLPTLAELLGVEQSVNWDGESYCDSLRKGVETGREALVLSQMTHVCQRSARFGDWLYIRTYHDGFHLFDREMLFCIKDDPYEQFDLKEKYPQICAQGAKIILDWHDEQMAKSVSVVDPLWTVLKEGGPYHTWNHLEEYLDRLRATGREEGARRLEKKHGNR